jgi:hypothetical protein
MAGRSPYRRPRRGRALLVVVALGLAGAFVISGAGLEGLGDDGSGGEPATRGALSESAEPTVPAELDGLFGDAVANGDGSVTVTLDEAETAGLVQQALAQAPSQQISDVTVEVAEPPADVGGRLVVDGRLDEPPVPVTAVVDLQVVDTRLRPTVSNLSMGPLPLSDDTRADLTNELRTLAGVADDQLALEDLSTVDGELVLTGRPR